MLPLPYASFEAMVLGLSVIPVMPATEIIHRQSTFDEQRPGKSDYLPQECGNGLWALGEKAKFNFSLSSNDYSINCFKLHPFGKPGTGHFQKATYLGNMKYPKEKINPQSICPQLPNRLMILSTE